MSVAARAVQDQHGIGDAASRIARRRSQSCVMQLQRAQGFAGTEFEIVNDEIAFLRGHRRRLLRQCGFTANKKHHNCHSHEAEHRELPDLL
jgi:hypothetical protein